MNTTQNTKWFQIGSNVVDSLGTGIAGTIEYVTEDGWYGVRDESGRLDELPAERAEAR